MDEYDPDSLQNLTYRWVEPWHWSMGRGRPQTRWKDALNRSLYKIGLVKEIKRIKRTEKTSRKPGRYRKSELDNRTSYFIIVDWTLVEIAAREKDEWCMLTLTLGNYEFSNSSRLFATDSGTSTQCFGFYLISDQNL